MLNKVSVMIHDGLLRDFIEGVGGTFLGLRLGRLDVREELFRILITVVDVDRFAIDRYVFANATVIR